MSDDIIAEFNEVTPIEQRALDAYDAIAYSKPRDQIITAILRIVACHVYDEACKEAADDYDHWKARAETAEADRDRERGLREFADNWAAIHAKQAAVLRDLEQAARAWRASWGPDVWPRPDEAALIAAVDALPAEETP